MNTHCQELGRARDGSGFLEFSDLPQEWHGQRWTSIQGVQDSHRRDSDKCDVDSFHQGAILSIIRRRYGELGPSSSFRSGKLVHIQSWCDSLAIPNNLILGASRAARNMLLLD